MHTQNDTRHKTSLKKDFIPTWIEDLSLLKESNASTFAVYHVLKFYAVESPTFEIHKITEGDIHAQTGLEHKTIRRALNKLEKLEKIIRIGYCRYRLVNFFKFSTTSGKMPEPTQNHFGQNARTTSGKMPDNFGQNARPLRTECPNPLYFNRNVDRDLKERSGDKSPIEQQEHNWLRMQYPFRDREGLKQHLVNRGYSEHDATMFMESFYQEYTGKAGGK